MSFFRFFRKTTHSTKNNYDEKSRPKSPRKPPKVNDISVESVSIDKLSKDEFVIAILGSTGSGKSSFINTASGSSSYVTEVGHSLKSCTKNIDAYRLGYPGFSVVLVDTPGFDNNQKMPDVKILDMISKWLKETYKQDILLTGILYFHKISDNRMAGPPFNLLRKFQKLCGKEAPKHIIFITTMWDETDDVEGEKREEQLKLDYWKTMFDLGTRTRRYWNNHASAWDIIHLAVDPTS